MKKKKPNAKNKLIFLDGQQKIFKYTDVPESVKVPPSPKIVETSGIPGYFFRVETCLNCDLGG